MKKVIKYILASLYLPIYFASYVFYKIARLMLCVAYLGLLRPDVARDIFVSLYRERLWRP